MKRILVPCDFSDSAVQAFKLAAEIGRQSDGEVFLLNVVEVPLMHETVIMPTLYFEQSFMNDMKASAEKKFAKMKEKWVKADQKVKLFIQYGSTSLMIRQFIKDKKIDLVVMGTHGASGAKEFFIGSNTEKIVRTSSVPVLAIKKATKLASIKNIVFANDIDLDAEELTLKVKDLQNFFKAKLHVLYVNTPSSFRRDSLTTNAMKDFAKRYMLKNYTLKLMTRRLRASPLRPSKLEHVFLL